MLQARSLGREGDTFALPAEVTPERPVLTHQDDGRGSGHSRWAWRHRWNFKAKIEVRRGKTSGRLLAVLLKLITPAACELADPREMGVYVHERQTHARSE